MNSLEEVRYFNQINSIHFLKMSQPPPKGPPGQPPQQPPGPAGNPCSRYFFFLRYFQSIRYLESRCLATIRKFSNFCSLASPRGLNQPGLNGYYVV